ncbi:MAG: 23S rRNA (pseudouridine(1915)-N(3))-methyltransferase RlmH [Alphaproteobacteria bacterium]
MLKIDIIAAGRMRGHMFGEASTEYSKRILWPLNIIEFDGRDQRDEESKILTNIKPGAYVIALDERGKDERSTDFAARLGKLQDSAESQVQFVIGGADGLTDAVREKSRLTMGLGARTWPHILARLMLLEQIYRAQQILAGHPYHRE